MKEYWPGGEKRGKPEAAARIAGNVKVRGERQGCRGDVEWVGKEGMGV